MFIRIRYLDFGDGKVVVPSGEMVSSGACLSVPSLGGWLLLMLMLAPAVGWAPRGEPLMFRLGFGHGLPAPS